MSYEKVGRAFMFSFWVAVGLGLVAWTLFGYWLFK